ncbi:MAG TPA: sugar kinase [Firmicutes bacterium]|nr:sugar kinase [Bacillota bacterium]
MSDSLLIVGSVAYDSVETPTGIRVDALGGSATFAAAAASLFTPVDLVGIVGDDFDLAGLSFVTDRGVDLTGLEIRKGGKTFRWSGVYETDVNIRHTRSTDLNVFADFNPTLPAKYRSDDVVFLGNMLPSLQQRVLEQTTNPIWVALDTMDLWINTTREELLDVMRKVQMVIINDSEARLLTGESNLVRAAQNVLTLGPTAVVVKKGEHGVFLVMKEGFAVLPALPLENVVDPTGAGDSFAGGMLGALNATRDFSLDGLKRAMAYGTATASLTCEAFSIDALKTANRDELNYRYEKLRGIASLPPLSV